MIKILKVKPCDLEWADKKTVDEYTTELIYKYGSILKGEEKLDSLTNIQFEDFARLQVCQFLAMDDIASDYMTMYLDEKENMFFVNFDALEEKMREVDVQIADEDGEDIEEIQNMNHYFPIFKLLLNQDLKDPFVHFDEKRNLFSVPSKVLVSNEAFVKELDLDISGLENKVDDIDNVLVWDEKEEVWVYTVDNVDLNSSDYDEFRINWNYASSQDVKESEEQFIAYDSEGNPCGRVFDISIINKNDLLCIRTEDGSEVIEEGENYDFSRIFGSEIKDDIMFIYINEPTDGFAFSVMLENGESQIIGTSVTFSDYNNIIDKFVYIEDKETLYVPIRAMSLTSIKILHKLGFSWKKEDIESIGCSIYSPLSDELRDRLVTEAMEDTKNYDLEYAIKNLLQKLAALNNVDDTMINYDDYVKEFMGMVLERCKGLNYSTYDIDNVLDNFDASNFGTLPEIESESESDDKNDSEEEDEIVFN